MKLLASILCLMLASLSTVQAQTIVINPPPGPLRAPVTGQRVSVNITMSMPIPPGAAASAWSAELNDANQALFSIVSAECSVLMTVFKGQCRLAHIETTGGINDRNNFGNPMAGPATAVNVTAIATFELQPVQAAAPTPPKQ